MLPQSTVFCWKLLLVLSVYADVLVVEDMNASCMAVAARVTASTAQTGLFSSYYDVDVAMRSSVSDFVCRCSNRHTDFLLHPFITS